MTGETWVTTPGGSTISALLSSTAYGRSGSACAASSSATITAAPGQPASRNAVEVYVGYLRRKLQAVGAGHLLRTVRGHGYRVGASG